MAATSSDIFGEEVFELNRVALSVLQSSLSAVTQGTTRQSSPQVRNDFVVLLSCICVILTEVSLKCVLVRVDVL